MERTSVWSCLPIVNPAWIGRFIFLYFDKRDLWQWNRRRGWEGTTRHSANRFDQFCETITTILGRLKTQFYNQTSQQSSILSQELLLVAVALTSRDWCCKVVRVVCCSDQQSLFRLVGIILLFSHIGLTLSMCISTSNTYCVKYFMIFIIATEPRNYKMKSAQRV